ncbi:MAG: major tail protein [Clostridia bacterium]
MGRKYLKGFSRFKYFPITENTLEKYLVGEGILIPSAQKLSKDLEANEENINADDEVWDIDRTVDGEKFTLTLAELPNDLRAKLEGGKYNEETKEYTFKTIDNAPEFACTYRGLLADGTYRMFRQYKCKVSKIKTELETKGNAKNGGVEIEGMFLSRACDSSLFTHLDTEEGNANLNWLDTIPSVTTTQGEQTE